MTDQKGKNSPVSTTESTSCNGSAKALVMALAMALRRILQWLCNLAILQWPILPSWNGSAKNVRKISSAQRTCSIGQDPPTCPNTSTGYECSICLQANSLKEKISLDCSHEFHSECVAPWLIKEGSCPVCREEFSIVEVSVSGNIGFEGIDNPGINMRLHNGCIDVSRDNGSFMRLYNVNIDERMFKDTFKNGGIEIKLDDGSFIKLNNVTDYSEEGGSLRINDGTIDARLMNPCMRRNSDGVRMISNNGSFINLNGIGFILTFIE